MIFSFFLSLRVSTKGWGGRMKKNKKADEEREKGKERKDEERNPCSVI